MAIHKIVLSREVSTETFCQVFRRYVSDRERSQRETYWVGKVGADGKFQLGYHAYREERSRVAQEPTIIGNRVAYAETFSAPHTKIDMYGSFYTQNGHSVIQYNRLVENSLTKKNFFSLFGIYFVIALTMAAVLFFILPAENRWLCFLGAPLFALIGAGINFCSYLNYENKLKNLWTAIVSDCEQAARDEE